MSAKLHQDLYPKRINAKVALIGTQPNKASVISAVHEAMRLADWKTFITPGADIALKPNLGWDKLIPGAISAPWVIEAVILMIQDYVNHIYLVESDQVVCSADEALKVTKLDEICYQYGIPWVNMSRGEFLEFKGKDRLVLKQVKIPKILFEAELITLPLMKTHNKTTITGALKNQWGCLEELRHNFHPVLSEALVDVNYLTQPRFAIMDATIALEGNGPKSGISKEMNLVLASGNIVGIDATAARIMGFDPKTISHLLLCEENGFGSLNPQVIGESIEEHKTSFIPAKHNLVSLAEILFRHSFISRLIFHTKIFNLMTFITRRYYDIWDIVFGKKIRNQIKDSKYYQQFIAKN